jgi:signal transduction histidine kinase
VTALRSAALGRSRRLPALPIRGADAWLALAVAVIQVALAFGISTHHHDGASAWRPLHVILILSGPAALVIRSSYPALSLALVMAGALANGVAGFVEGPLYPSMIVAVVAAVAAGRRRAGLAGLAVGYVGSEWFEPLVGQGRYPSVGASLGLAAWLLVLYGAGEAIRYRSLREAQRAQVRNAETRQRVSEERLRIAREVHDILAHNISLINVQAGTALHRARRSEEDAYRALHTIKQVSQNTLGELRSLLGALRESGEEAPRAPVPGLARLEELVSSATASGVTVNVEVTGGQPSLPAGVDLACYRIVQEALTNVARHAGPARTAVRVSYGKDDVVVEVEDDGRADGVFVVGTGITGMAERANALGGTLDAGPRPGGGFRVRAWLPLRRGS